MKESTLKKKAIENRSAIVTAVIKYHRLSGKRHIEIEPKIFTDISEAELLEFHKTQAEKAVMFASDYWCGLCMGMKSPSLCQSEELTVGNFFD